MLLLNARCVPIRAWTSVFPRTRRLRHEAHTQAFEPLRIIYCGSDEFSSQILERLHKEATCRPSFISSIDVVTKQGKRAGRGLKAVRNTPCLEKAVELGLKHYEIPTFTGWTAPPSNLVIAVSFGLLVPPRILDGAEYGGLNLHPSLLPDLWGPAPLHHALLEGRKTTGVTLQTLHPRHFDRGRIVASRAFDIPNQGSTSLDQLRDTSMHMGAALLIDSLRQGLFLNGASSDTDETFAQHKYGQTLTHARKLTSEDAHVDWHTWTTARVLRTMNALGTVWSYENIAKKGVETRMRVIWKELDPADGLPPDVTSQMDAGRLYGIQLPGRNETLTVVKAADNGVLVVRAVGLEGHGANTSMRDAARMLGRQNL